MINFLGQSEAKVIGVNIIYSGNDLNQGLLEVRDIIKGIEADPRLLKSIQVNTLICGPKRKRKTAGQRCHPGRCHGREQESYSAPHSLRWEILSGEGWKYRIT
jgi:hypothetical protein